MQLHIAFYLIYYRKNFTKYEQKYQDIILCLKSKCSDLLINYINIMFDILILSHLCSLSSFARLRLHLRLLHTLFIFLVYNPSTIIHLLPTVLRLYFHYRIERCDQFFSNRELCECDTMAWLSKLLNREWNCGGPTDDHKGVAETNMTRYRVKICSRATTMTTTRRNVSRWQADMCAHVLFGEKKKRWKKETIGTPRERIDSRSQVTTTDTVATIAV